MGGAFIYWNLAFFPFKKAGKTNHDASLFESIRVSSRFGLFFSWPPPCFLPESFPLKTSCNQQKSGKIGPIKEGSQAAAHLPMYHATKPSKQSQECIRPQEDHNEKGHQPETKNGVQQTSGKFFGLKGSSPLFFGNSSAVEIWYALKNHVFMPPFGIAPNVRSWEACFWRINCINWIWTALGLWLHEDFQTDPLSNREPRGLAKIDAQVWHGFFEWFFLETTRCAQESLNGGL